LVVADSADYDSTAMAWVPVHFDTVPAFRIDQRSGGLRLRTWIDAQGHVVRATSPAGFALQRSAFEIAYDNFRHRDTARLAQATATSRAGEIIAATAIAAGVGPELSPPAELRLRIGGIAFPPQSVGEKSEAREAGLDLGGGRQLLSGDTLVVRREGPAPPVARYHLPATDT